MKAGTRGISMLAASGDVGVGCITEGHEQVFGPFFPSGIPYITAVGGTTSFSPERTAELSSGGFSNFWSAPDYQKDFIENYKNQAGSSLPS